MIFQRQHQIELMDQPDLDRQLHLAALGGLRRINAISRSAKILWPSIAEAAKLSTEPLRVLDLACGSGDNVLSLAQRARREQQFVEVRGCDVSTVAITAARRSAESQGFDPSNYFQLDVLREPLPSGFHVIMCSLFLHHLSREDAIYLMRKMAEATKRLVLICDLRRTWRGLGLAWAGSRLLTRSPIVHVDAVRSVAAAFAESEIEAIKIEAGLDGGVVSRHWPQRWLLLWRKP